MPISLERYVAITSGVIGAQAVADREYVGLRFTTDPRLPVDTVLAVDRTGAGEYFGANSDEAEFAAQYFAYVSPAPASTPRTLRFAPWANVARAARIYGAAGAYLVPAFAAVTDGSLNLTLAEHTAEVVGLDLSTAVTLADVATALQGAIRAEVAGGAHWTGAVVAYDSAAQAFTLVSGSTGAAPISIAGAATGTDLAPLLGWTGGDTILSPGAAAQTAVEALAAAAQVTNSFGSFSFDPEVLTDSATIVALAQYNAALNVEFMLWHGVTAANAATLSALVIGIASTGLVLNGVAGQHKEAGLQAIQAAIDYNRRNAVVSFMYRQVSGLTADVSTDDDANTYDALRVNYYGQTASAGQNIAFFQRGFLMGGATAPLDAGVHANEQWLKSYIASRLLSLQLSLGKLPANAEGRGYVMGVVNAAANRAKFNGTISVGKALTVEQQIAVTQLTGDGEAWREVQTNGFWLDVEIVAETGPSQVTEYVALYTLAYSKNDVVRAIRGSHNLI